jgi:hypothetical protein
MGPSAPSSTSLSRLVVGFYLATLALLPWSWFPPFPWLHEHAQWSDVLFLATATLWVIEQTLQRQLTRLRPFHAALLLYLGAACLSWLGATGDPRTGTWKLLGIAELCALAWISSDLAARPGVGRLAAWVIAASFLLTAAAALAGFGLFLVGVETRLVGNYSHLVPSRWYARVQGGFYHPNLLVSFCTFVAAVLSYYRKAIPRRLWRVLQLALGNTVLLTISFGILGFVLAAWLRSVHTRVGRWGIGVYTAGCVALIITFNLLNPAIDLAAPSRSHLNLDQPSMRRQAIISSLDTLADYPLFGTGPDGLPGEYRGQPCKAHLTPLNIAATLGLPALLAFALLIVVLWRGRRGADDQGLWSGLAGLALDSLTSDIEYFRHLWVLLGFIDASSRKSG